VRVRVGVRTRVHLKPGEPDFFGYFFGVQITVQDDLVKNTHLDTLTEAEARLALAVGLFAEERLTLAQAAQFAGFDFLGFQRELALRQIPVHYGSREFAEDLADLISEAL
jgi:predicted HTH domain antitoxin